VKSLTVLLTFILLQSGTSKPYPETKVTKAMVDDALGRARAEHKFLMIEFGANWCEDCVALAQNLEQGQPRDYLQKHFRILKVDVGQFDRNLDIAKALSVDLNKGIPTAVFFAPDGNRVGATNNGEFEPARKYGSRQIYSFLKQIAERHVITVPGR